VNVNVVEGPAGLLLFEKLGIEITGAVAPGDRPRRDQLRVTNPDGSVYSGQLLSPSALGTGEKCERQFGYTYIDKLPRLTTKAQEVGTATHAELEAWLIEGVPPRTPLLTSSGALSHFPSPKTRGLEVETVFAFRATLLRAPEALDVPGAREAIVGGEVVSAVLYGYKDAQLVSPDLDAVTVFDLKTTSSLAWAKTPDELLCDTQSVVYGIDGLLSAPGAMSVKLRWVYTQTKNAHCSRPTDVTMDWAHVEALLANRVARAWRLGLLKERMEKGTAKTLKPNTRACGDYGGCQFLPLCDDLSTATGFLSLSRQTRLEGERKALPATAHTGNTMVSILAKMKSDLAKKGVATEAVEALEQAAPTVAVSSTVTPAVAATPPPAPPAPPAPVVAPSAPAPAASAPAATPAPTSAPNALKSALAKLKGEVLVPAATPAPAAPAAPAALPTGINPPDARPPGVVDPAPAVAAPAPAAPEKRKPGRPKKVVEAASEAPTSSAAPEAPAAPAPTPTPAPATAPLPREWVEAELPASLSAPSGFTLMLDVAPVKGMAFQNIEDVLSAARTKVELEAGCSDRLIDYGKGPAFLAEQLEENFKIEPPCGAFFASSYGLDKEVLDVLVRHASVVFRATR
jgi:hypothetical protein